MIRGHLLFSHENGYNPRIRDQHGEAPSLEGRTLLIAEPDSEDLAPQIVIDNLGAGIGQKVLISSDGSEARKIVGDELSPARWAVLGIIDPERSLAL